jgi:N-acetylglucosamine-6-phosphate deacetylase
MSSHADVTESLDRSASLVIANGRVLSPNRSVHASVVVAGDRIVAIVPDGESLPPADRVVDVAGAYIAPGFIDIHIHGAAGVDVLDATEAELDRLSSWLAAMGVTRFVPTLVALPLEAYGPTVARLARWIARRSIEPPVGAVPVGLHFEGPFLNVSRCGALDPDTFLDGSHWNAFYDAIGADGLAGIPARLVTVAPEIPGGIGLIRGAVARGFTVSVGHTEAGAAILDLALEAGARHVTHFMNAMPTMHHRDPGPVAWVLDRKRLSVDLIADFVHVHPDVVRFVINVLTSTRVALISDSVPPTGLGDGEFHVWSETIRVEGHRTEGANGTLAGSVIASCDAVRNVLGLGVTALDAARMASTVPARVLGFEALGAIAEGKVADLIAFRDDVRPLLTVVAGRLVVDPDA